MIIVDWWIVKFIVKLNFSGNRVISGKNRVSDTGTRLRNIRVSGRVTGNWKNFGSGIGQNFIPD